MLLLNGFRQKKYKFHSKILFNNNEISHCSKGIREYLSDYSSFLLYINIISISFSSFLNMLDEIQI